MERGFKQCLKKKNTKPKKHPGTRTRDHNKHFSRDLEGYKIQGIGDKTGVGALRPRKLMGKEKKHRRNLKSLNAFTIQSKGLGLLAEGLGSSDIGGERRGLKSRGLGVKLRAQKTRSKIFTESQLIKFRKQSQMEGQGRGQEQVRNPKSKTVNVQLQMPKPDEANFREVQHHMSPAMSRPTSPDNTDYSNFVSISSRNFNNPTGKTNGSETSQKRSIKPSKPKARRRRKKPGHFRNQSHQLGSIGNNFSGLHSIRNLQRNKKSPILGHMSKSNFIHPNSMVSPITKFQKKPIGYGISKGGFPSGSAFVKKKNPFSRHRKNMSSNFSGLVKGRRGLPLSFAEGEHEFGSELRKEMNEGIVPGGLRSEELEKNTQSIGFSQSFNTNQSNSQVPSHREQTNLNHTPKKRSKRRKKNLLDLGKSQNSRLMSKLGNPNLNLRVGLSKPNKLFSLSNNKQKAKFEGPLRGKNPAIREVKRKMNKTVGQGGGLQMVKLKQYNTNSSIPDSERTPKPNELDPRAMQQGQPRTHTEYSDVRDKNELSDQLRAKRKGDKQIIDSKHMIEITKRVRKQKKRQQEIRKRKGIHELVNHDFVKKKKKSGYFSQRSDWQSHKMKDKEDFQSHREGYGLRDHQKPVRRMDPLELVDYIGKRKSHQDEQAEIGLGEFVNSRGLSQRGSSKIRNTRSKQKKWAKSSLRSERGLGRLGPGVGLRDVQSQMGSEYSEIPGNSIALETGTGFESESTNIYQGKSTLTDRSRKSAFGGSRVGKVLLRDNEGREYWVPLSVLVGQHPGTVSNKKSESQRQISTNPDRPWGNPKISQKSENETLVDSVASLKEQIMKESRESSLKPKMGNHHIQKNILQPFNQPPKNSPSNQENLRIGGKSGKKRFEIFSETNSEMNSEKKSSLLMGIYGKGTKGKRKLRIRQNQIKKIRQKEQKEELIHQAENSGRLDEKLISFRDDRVTIKDRENIKNMDSLRSWELDSFAKEGWGANESQAMQRKVAELQTGQETARPAAQNPESEYSEQTRDITDILELNSRNSSATRNDKPKKEFVLDLATEEMPSRQVSRQNSTGCLKSPKIEHKAELMEGLLSEGEDSKSRNETSRDRVQSSTQRAPKYIRVSGKKTSGKKFEIFGNESDCEIKQSLSSSSSSDSQPSVKQANANNDNVITYSNLNANQKKKAKKFFVLRGDEDSEEEEEEGPRPPNVSSRYDSENVDQGSMRMLKNLEVQMGVNLVGDNQIHNFQFPELKKEENETLRDFKVGNVYQDSGDAHPAQEDPGMTESDLLVKGMGDNLLYKERRADPRESEGNLYNGKVGAATKKGVNQSNISNRKTSNNAGERLFDSRISKNRHNRIEIGRDRMKSNRMLQDLKRFSKEVEIPAIADWIKKPSNNVAKRKRNRHKKNAYSEHIPDIFTEFVQKIGAPINLQLKVNNMTPVLSRKGSSDEDQDEITIQHKINKIGRHVRGNDFASLRKRTKGYDTGKRDKKAKVFSLKESHVRKERRDQDRDWYQPDHQPMIGSDQRDYNQDQAYKVYQQEDFSGLFGGGGQSEEFVPRQEVSDIDETDTKTEDLVYKKQKKSEKINEKKILLASDLDAGVNKPQPQTDVARAQVMHQTPQFSNKNIESKRIFLEDNDPNKYGSNKQSKEETNDPPNQAKVKKRKRRINFIDMENYLPESKPDSAVSSRAGLAEEFVPTLPNQNRERLKLIEQRRLREIQAFKRKRAQIQREQIDQSENRLGDNTDSKIVIRSNKQNQQNRMNKSLGYNQAGRNFTINEKSIKTSSTPKDANSSKGQSNMAPNSIVNSFGNHTPAQMSSRSNRISITIISHQSSRNSEINNIRINHSLRSSQKAMAIPETVNQSNNVFHIDSTEGGAREATQNQQIQIDVRASDSRVEGVGVGLEMGNGPDANNFTLGNQQLSREMGPSKIDNQEPQDSHCINVNIPAINSSFEESASFGNSEESERSPITENTFGQGMGQMLEENRPPASAFRHSFGMPNPRTIGQTETGPIPDRTTETQDQQVENIEVRDIDPQFNPEIVSEAEQTIEKKNKTELYKRKDSKKQNDYVSVSQNRNQNSQMSNVKDFNENPSQPKNSNESKLASHKKKSNEFFYEQDSSFKGSNSENSSRGKHRKITSKSTHRGTREMIIRAHVRDGIRGNFNSPVRKKRLTPSRFANNHPKIPKESPKPRVLGHSAKDKKETHPPKSKKRESKSKTKDKTGTRSRYKKRGAHLKNSLMIGMGRQKIRAELKLYENKSSLSRVNKSRVRSRNSSPLKKKTAPSSKAGKRTRTDKRAGEKHSERVKSKSKGKSRKGDSNAIRRRKSRNKLESSESRVKKAGRKNSSNNPKPNQSRDDQPDRGTNSSTNQTQIRKKTNASRGNSQQAVRRTELAKPPKVPKKNQMAHRNNHQRDHSEVITNQRRRQRRDFPRRRMESDELDQKRILETKILKYLKGDQTLFTNLEFYRLKKMLGQGSYAKVYLGESVLCGGKVAIKKYEKSGLKKKSSMERVFTEIKILKKMNHHNIIKFLEIFENQMYVFIVLEYGDGGDLLNHLKQSGRFSEETFKKILQQIIDGLSYIHSLGILHRDIKLDNIIYTTDRTVKICDFGISRKMDKGKYVYEHIGTPAYLAPEIILECGYTGFSADIWSLGVTSFMAMTGNVPFKGSTIDELHEAILKKNFKFPEKPKLSTRMKKTIRGMLKKDPEKRFTLKQVCKTLGLTVPLPLSRHREKEYADPRTIGVIKGFGFPENYIKTAIENDEINHVTALYKLLQS